MKPLAIILGLNALILVGLYAEAYAPGSNSSDKGVILFAPFALSAINLCLGLLSVVVMFVLKRVDKTAAAVADKSMQAFMIAFGLVFAFGVPACFLGLSHL